uniref:Uncharacterized protein n=1 Tax=Candidatus Kentrum sp. FW TaxID=2126338 RepID=A0A450TPS6_9GAMM|nr:MAG: hypothetical protein BECKFW1821A_GA0114235_105414 [Candidatus Kentron sp. FW]VFJ69968.1 MAG: hypothetical protein BECKFW1821B_GA0114236_11761 [Candidatus Kentron sp. FW]
MLSNYQILQIIVISRSPFKRHILSDRQGIQCPITCIRGNYPSLEKGVLEIRLRRQNLP